MGSRVATFRLFIILKNGEAKADIISQPDATPIRGFFVYPWFFTSKPDVEMTGNISLSDYADTLDGVCKSDITT